MVSIGRVITAARRGEGTPSYAARAPVTLRGRWLLLARAAFVAFIMVALWLDLGAYAREFGDAGSLWFLGLGVAEVAPPASDEHPTGIALAVIVGPQILADLFGYGAAILLVRRRSREVIALLVALFLVASAAARFPTTLFARVATEPVRATLGLIVTCCFPLTLVLLFYLFPDGRFTPRWTIVPAVCWALGLASGFFIRFIRPSAASGGPWNDGIIFGIILASIVAAQVYRYRWVSGPVERQQTKWFLGGLGVALVTFMAGNILLDTVDGFDPGATGAGVAATRAMVKVAFGLTGLCVPVGLTIAVLKYRLFAIDVAINRALVYGGLTAAVIGLYVLVVGYLGQLFAQVAPAGGNLAIALVATGLVAVLFQPLHGWLQRGANRLVYGERDEPYAVISRLGRRLEGALTPDAILPTIVETVAGALKLPYAAIALDGDTGRAVVAAIGTPPPDPLRLPLAYQGEPVGELLLAPRASGEAFSPADRRLLDDLARQTGRAGHAVRLADEARQLAAALQASRERLVTAREEERRRLRRDLHDGLGPQLASQALTVDAAGLLLERDPQGAAALLREVKAQSQAAVAEIRRVAYALRPPALDDLGLAGALHEAASRYAGTGLAVAVVAPEPLLSLPAAVEVAAYRIAQEAINNVARHARASCCTVTLVPTDGALTVTVADDGVGISADRRAGVGLSSMRERAEELGGVCLVEPNRGGGTRVAARLPL